MARREITTPLDLSNLNNHNKNYEELYNQLKSTDERLSENMWDELKDANTMKMLEPVQTTDDLPAEADDKSLITVIDEQRVYAYVHDEWQPFSEIDLDPFSPFKEELADIVSEYESKIKDITSEVEGTKSSAIESIENTQNQSESNIKETEQSATETIEDAQAEVETKTEAFTEKFNDYMSQLTDEKDSSLDDIEQARKDALAELDTDDWQKHKITEDDGYIPRIEDPDMDDLDSFISKSGLFYVYHPTNAPIDENGYLQVIMRSESYGQVRFTPFNGNDEFIQNKQGSLGWTGWERPAGVTHTELYDGEVMEIDSEFTLSENPKNYAYLIVYGSNGDGKFVTISYAYDEDDDIRFLVKDFGVYPDAKGVKIYEIECESVDSDTRFRVANSVYFGVDSNEGEESKTNRILRIVGVK